MEKKTVLTFTVKFDVEYDTDKDLTEAAKEIRENLGMTMFAGGDHNFGLKSRTARRVKS